MIEQLHICWVDPDARILSIRFSSQTEIAGLGVGISLDGGEWAGCEVERLDDMNGLVRYRSLAPADSALNSLCYRVLQEEKVLAERQVFLPPQNDEAFRCIFFADTGLIGRSDGNADGTEAIYREIENRSPRILLGGGDYAYANKDDRFDSVPDAVDEWFRQAEGMISRFPFFAQYGNHENVLKECYEDWAPRFDHPQGFDEQKCYSFDFGSAHIVSFFTGRPRPQKHHLEWLENDLGDAKEKGDKWLVVFTHEPVFGHGFSHPSSFMVSSSFGALCERMGADLVLGAHDQSYERTYPVSGVPHNVRATSKHTSSYKRGEGVIFAKVSPSGKRSEIGHTFSKFQCPQHDFMASRNDTRHHFAELAIEKDRLGFTCLYYESESGAFGVEDSFTIR